MSVVVREARPEEYAEVGRLTVEAYREFADRLSWWDEYAARLNDVASRAGEGLVLVAEEDGRLVGAVTYYPPETPPAGGWPPEWAAVRALAVSPTHRRRGVGRVLMEECLDRAAAAGAPLLALHTVSVMTAAQAMYESLGFRRLAEHERADRGVLAYGKEPAPKGVRAAGGPGPEGAGPASGVSGPASGAGREPGRQAALSDPA